MMRIRTVKPEFFQHEGLFEAEQRYGLPLRLAFEGLWGAADRRGVFEWRPRRLKVQVLPYDKVDMRQVLHALVDSGFVMPYRGTDGKEYGFIPSFERHQYINNREAPSHAPDPPGELVEEWRNGGREHVLEVAGFHQLELLAPQLLASQQVDASTTREPRVSHASTTREPRVPEGREGKGREVKGKEVKGKEMFLHASETRGLVELVRFVHEQHKQLPREAVEYVAGMVFRYWAICMERPKVAYTPDRKQKIITRLKLYHYDPTALLYAIDAVYHDDHAMGRDGGRTYNDIRTIFKNDATCDEWANQSKRYTRDHPHPFPPKYAEEVPPPWATE